MFIKFSDVITAIKVPNNEDFALGKPEKARKRSAVRTPSAICESKIPKDILRGLVISIVGFI